MNGPGSVPDRQGPSTAPSGSGRLSRSRAFFVDRLGSSEGARAREYLAGRGIGRELVVESYGSSDSRPGRLGRASPACETVITERSLVEAGLAIEAQGGAGLRPVPNRVIVPIESSGGAPVGFGGRILADEEPKYLNSPETPVYRKGSVLFGAAQARTAIREENRVLVVEGYFDVLALAQSGIGSAVGTCGTALTPSRPVTWPDTGAGSCSSSTETRRASGPAPCAADRGRRTRRRSGALPTPRAGPGRLGAFRGGGSGAARPGARLTPVTLEERMLAGALTRDDAARQAVGLVARISDPLTRDLWGP
ncbi:MAG: toprim domain-containing protein [Candidatus Eisenbacteria bacterium]